MRQNRIEVFRTARPEQQMTGKKQAGIVLAQKLKMIGAAFLYRKPEVASTTDYCYVVEQQESQRVALFRVILFATTTSSSR